LILDRAPRARRDHQSPNRAETGLDAQQAAILAREQVAQLLEHANPGYRPQFEFLAYTSLRVGEANPSITLEGYAHLSSGPTTPRWHGNL